MSRWVSRASNAVRVFGKQCAWRQSSVLAGEEDAALKVGEALESQASCARSLAEMTRGGSRSSGAHSLAGMTKTSICVLHETDREGCRQTSTCVLHVTDREGDCLGGSSGPEGGTELRLKRDESLDKVLALSVLVTRRGLGGIWRNHATESMLWDVVDISERDGRFGLGFVARGSGSTSPPKTGNVLNLGG